MNDTNDITVKEGTLWEWDGATFCVRNRGDQRTYMHHYDLELTCVAAGPYHDIGHVGVESTERLRKYAKIVSVK